MTENEVKFKRSRQTHFIIKSSADDRIYKNLAVRNFMNFMEGKTQAELLDFFQQNFVTGFEADPIPERFNQKNEFQSEFETLVNNLDKKDFIQNQAQRIIKFNGESILTRFTDFQVFTICAGVEQAYLRKLARNYFRYLGQMSKKELFEAHQAVNNLVKIQGMEMVKFIMTLPALPFGMTNAERIFSQFDNKSKLNDYPSVRLNIGNDKDSRNVMVSFSTEKGNLNNSVLALKDRETHQVILSFDSTGRMIPGEEVKNIFPTLLLFKRYAEDQKGAKKLVLNYGLKTGECALCGAQLTDPDSIIRGIGPECMKHI